NVRLNSTHKISKVFTVSQTLGYTHSKSMGIGNVNSEFGGPLSSAINLDPITPIFETDPAKLANASLYPAHAVRDANGNVFGISQAGVQEMSNPLAYIQTRLGRYNWDDNFVGNISLEAAKVVIPVVTSETRSEEHTSELQSRENLVCRLLLEKKN